VHFSTRVSLAAVGLMLTALVVTSCEINRRESPLAYYETMTSELPSGELPSGELRSGELRSVELPSVDQLAPPFTDSDVAWNVVEVLDGTTIRVDGVGGSAEVRLLGVRLPTNLECLADLAVNGLRFFTSDVEVRLVSEQNLVDAAGRLLRHVDTVDGIDVAAEMIRAGFLTVADPQNAIARSAAYFALEETARAQQRGQWADEVCAAPTP
jgi:endonuclease YncB( thermonuclease family)